MTEAVRPYRGVSAVDRRDLRRVKLLDGCLQVVGTKGIAGATVDAVCTSAGLSKRYFYESFADLDALLSAALEAVLDAVRVAIMDALRDAPDDVGHRVAVVAEALVRTLSDDASGARLYVEAPGHLVLHERRDTAVEQFGQLLIDHVLGVDATRERDRAGVLIVVAGTTELVSRWLAGRLDLDRAELIGAICDIGSALADRFR